MQRTVDKAELTTELKCEKSSGRKVGRPAKRKNNLMVSFTKRHGTWGLVRQRSLDSLSSQAEDEQPRKKEKHLNTTRENGKNIEAQTHTKGATEGNSSNVLRKHHNGTSSHHEPSKNKSKKHSEEKRKLTSMVSISNLAVAGGEGLQAVQVHESSCEAPKRKRGRPRKVDPSIDRSRLLPAVNSEASDSIPKSKIEGKEEARQRRLDSVSSQAEDGQPGKKEKHLNTPRENGVNIEAQTHTKGATEESSSNLLRKHSSGTSSNHEPSKNKSKKHSKEKLKLTNTVSISNLAVAGSGGLQAVQVHESSCEAPKRKRGRPRKVDPSIDRSNHSLAVKGEASASIPKSKIEGKRHRKKTSNKIEPCVETAGNDMWNMVPLQISGPVLIVSQPKEVYPPLGSDFDNSSARSHSARQDIAEIFTVYQVPEIHPLREFIMALREFFLRGECLICGFVAPVDGYNASQHMEEHVSFSGVEVYYQCRRCTGQFLSPSDLYSHSFTCNKAFNYACDYCYLKFKRWYHFQRHNVEVHGMSVAENCPLPSGDEVWKSRGPLVEEVPAWEDVKPQILLQQTPVLKEEVGLPSSCSSKRTVSGCVSPEVKEESSSDTSENPHYSPISCRSYCSDSPVYVKDEFQIDEWEWDDDVLEMMGKDHGQQASSDVDCKENILGLPQSTSIDRLDLAADQQRPRCSEKVNCEDKLSRAEDGGRRNLKTGSSTDEGDEVERCSYSEGNSPSDRDSTFDEIERQKRRLEREILMLEAETEMYQHQQRTSSEGSEEILSDSCLNEPVHSERVASDNVKPVPRKRRGCVIPLPESEDEEEETLQPSACGGGSSNSPSDAQNNAVDRSKSNCLVPPNEDDRVSSPQMPILSPQTSISKTELNSPANLQSSLIRSPILQNNKNLGDKGKAGCSFSKSVLEDWRNCNNRALKESAEGLEFERNHPFSTNQSLSCYRDDVQFANCQRESEIPFLMLEDAMKENVPGRSPADDNDREIVISDDSDCEILEDKGYQTQQLSPPTVEVSKENPQVSKQSVDSTSQDHPESTDFERHKKTLLQSVISKLILQEVIKCNALQQSTFSCQRSDGDDSNSSPRHLGGSRNSLESEVTDQQTNISQRDCVVSLMRLEDLGHDILKLHASADGEGIESDQELAKNDWGSAWNDLEDGSNEIRRHKKSFKTLLSEWALEDAEEEMDFLQEASAGGEDVSENLASSSDLQCQSRIEGVPQSRFEEQLEGTRLVDDVGAVCKINGDRNLQLCASADGRGSRLHDVKAPGLSWKNIWRERRKSSAASISRKYKLMRVRMEMNRSRVHGSHSENSPSGHVRPVSCETTSRSNSIHADGRNKLTTLDILSLYDVPEDHPLSKGLMPLLEYFIKGECLICGFTAPEEGYNPVLHLKDHVYEHYGLYPRYVCQCCDLKFINCTDLYIHSLSRDKNIKYPCGVCCQLVFKRRYHIERHVRKRERKQSRSLSYRISRRREQTKGLKPLKKTRK